MTFSGQMLAALLQYGLPFLFGLVAVASFGAPLPINLLLIASGSFTQQHELNLWQVIGVGSVAAVAGDHAGYFVGRWGSVHLAARMRRWLGGEDRFEKAEAMANRWGGLGIFLTRWLITPISPWVNLTSGLAEYPWPLFLVWDVAGEVLFVALYVELGRIFSDRIQAVGDALGELVWAIVGLAAAVLLGWVLFGYLRRTGARA